MKKIFISQPMKDKTDGEILEERTRCIKVAKEILKDDDVTVIDSFFKGAPEKYSPLQCLSKSISKLDEADLVFFAKDWNKYRGCKIEHRIAIDYGIPVMTWEEIEVQED